MDSDQLLSFIDFFNTLHNLNLDFYVLPKGEIMKTVSFKKYPIVIINNSQAYPDKGEHWLLFIILSPKLPILFFDSYGNSPEYYGLEISTSTSKIIKNNCQFQAQNSSTCGVYCLYVLYLFFVLKKQFTEILSKEFSVKSYKLNDCKVINFYKTLCCKYKLCLKVLQGGRKMSCCSKVDKLKGL